MATDKTDKQASLPNVASATTADIAASALAPFLHRRIRSLTRSRDACDAELLIISGQAGFETRVSYLKKRIQDINSQLFPLVGK